MSKEPEYTMNDYRYGAPPRLFGSETEYTTNTDIQGNIINRPGSPNFSEFLDEKYIAALEDEGREQIIHTTTGGKIYIDCKPIEYATPECTSPEELLLHEKAGEVLVEQIVENLSEHYRTPARLTKRSGYARVRIGDELVMAEDSIGHHENYSSISSISSSRRILSESWSPKLDMKMNKITELRGLADYLALRKIIDGAGMVGQFGYELSQKPTAINYRSFQSSLEHGNKKPFYADINQDRLEVRTGEGNKSDFVVKLKHGLTSLVLRLVEHRRWPEHLVLADPSKAALRLSANPHTTVKLENGLDMKALDVLLGIVDEAADLASEYDVPKYEIRALNDFYTLYDDLQKVSLRDDEVASVADRLDWAARYQHLLSHGGTYETLHTRNLEFVKQDLLWDMCGEGDKARHHYRKFGHSALTRKIPKPPMTRAHIRTKLASSAFATGDLHYMSWENIYTNHGTAYTFYNPHDPHNYTERYRERP